MDANRPALHRLSPRRLLGTRPVLCYYTGIVYEGAHSGRYGDTKAIIPLDGRG